MNEHGTVLGPPTGSSGKVGARDAYSLVLIVL